MLIIIFQLTGSLNGWLQKTLSSLLSIEFLHLRLFDTSIVFWGQFPWENMYNGAKYPFLIFSECDGVLNKWSLLWWNKNKRRTWRFLVSNFSFFVCSNFSLPKEEIMYNGSCVTSERMKTSLRWKNSKIGHLYQYDDWRLGIRKVKFHSASKLTYNSFGQPPLWESSA